MRKNRSSENGSAVAGLVAGDATVQSSQEEPVSRTAAVAARGIRTSGQFIDFFTALICDLATGSIDIKVAREINNAADRSLRLLEMQVRPVRPVDGDFQIGQLEPITGV